MCRRPHPRVCAPGRQVKTLGFESLLAVMLAKQCREHGAGDGRDVRHATEPRNDLLRTDGNHDRKTMGFEEDHFHGTCRKPSQKCPPTLWKQQGNRGCPPQPPPWGSHYIGGPPLHLRGHPGTPCHVTSSQKIVWGACPLACQPRGSAPLELSK